MLIATIKRLFKYIFNLCIKKDPNSILFFPHYNCISDGYDILNADSDNVLCLFNTILRDPRFNNFNLYVLYYHNDRLESYIRYCQPYNSKRVHFIKFEDDFHFFKSFTKCSTIFTDCDYIRIQYKTSKQKIICLNYFGGLIKSEFHRWSNNGGFPRMLQEQMEMHRIYDYVLSISDICAKFIALDNCHYYGNFLTLGFPRNDILFKKQTELRNSLKQFVNFKFKHIITYVPTHRDYENPTRDFYDKTKTSIRSIWGHIENNDLTSLENLLTQTETLIIAKVHPIQQAQTSVIKNEKLKHVIFYSDLVKNIKTSLNPLLAISDSIITDYTTTVYDFLYLDRPIIYYFYDIEEYRKTRGFFIDPIESICAGHITHTISELQSAIQDVTEGKDPGKEKRKFLRQLFIKYPDGGSTQRILNFFFPSKRN